MEILLSISLPRALYLVDLVRDKRRFLQGATPRAAPQLNWAEIYDGLCPEQTRASASGWYRCVEMEEWIQFDAKYGKSEEKALCW